jgi:glyoxylase-like metal-dependent hydrolase (beta-lactamase superfamily II)
MPEAAESPVEVRDVADGLWIWRLRHPHWNPKLDWQPIVTSVCVDVNGEVLLLDPLMPPAKNREVWTRLESRPPTAAVVLKPDHVRDVDLVVRLYPVRAFGPALFWPNDVPRTELEPVEPGSQLPGGLIALYDGRGKNETPLWLPQHRTLVFADALTEREGKLRVWSSRSHEERALPALQKLLDLPFERVIISHGNPVHDRVAFEKALTLPPWAG